MKKISLSEKAYQIIKNDIITCALEPGLQTTQPQLMDRYGLSTTPIREALQRLGQEGMIQPIPHFGYIIAPISVSDVHEVYELRLVLETAVVRLAIERASREQLDILKKEADFTYKYHDRQSYIEFLNRNTEFHYSVAKLTNNERLANLVYQLLVEMLRIFHLGLDLQDSGVEMRDEHLTLINLMLQKESEKAEQVMRDQIIRSQERVLNAISRRSGLLKHVIQIR